MKQKLMHHVHIIYFHYMLQSHHNVSINVTWHYAFGSYYEVVSQFSCLMMVQFYQNT